MSSDFITPATNLFSIIIAVVTLGGFMYKIGDWINKKAEKKAELLKTVTDKAATDLKIATENTAKDLKEYTDETATTLKEYTDKTLNAMTDKMANIDNKVMTMLKDLADRSDLVNGNVANIRSDLIDLQDQVTELAADVDRNQNGEETEDAVINRKKVYIERRKKRQQIERDRDAQDHPLHGKGRDIYSSRRDDRR